ncbi:ROK family protein [Nicoliella lavandulae]|uniref:fructokinase n=1 Tax=Nicoliella lavandulae TaxID=3082954 RepID=A0ABU8SLN5_9LACO
MLLGSIEAGGTKFICAVGNEQYTVIDSITIPTTVPGDTLSQAVRFFEQYQDQGLSGIGISSFGPIEVRKSSSKYGYIIDTPKQGWSDVDFLGPFKKFNIPLYWTTDVNGSAYGEYVLSLIAQKPIQSLVYYTVGTGVGAGIYEDDHFLGAAGHPEAGHVYVKRHPDDLDFKGICPAHGDCLEGLVCGPTFEARLGMRGQDVPLDNPVWDIMAYYVAQAAIQSTLLIRPNVIIFGGGVISEPFLKLVRDHFKHLFKDYVTVGDLDSYLRMPLAKNNGSATIGNFALALYAINQAK